jgi:hypothetical protein
VGPSAGRGPRAKLSRKLEADESLPLCALIVDCSINAIEESEIGESISEDLGGRT